MIDDSGAGNITSYCLNNPNTNVCEILCSNNPNLPICSAIPSYYYYRLDIVANSFFLAVFSLSLIGYLVTYAATRRGLGFTMAMTLGLIAEILGYTARIMSWQNQWSETPFFMQICCLAFGPAFMAAGVYLCLRRVVFTFGPENSRIPPQWYTRTVCLRFRFGSCIPHQSFVTLSANGTTSSSSLAILYRYCYRVLAVASQAWRGKIIHR
jgi:hypothetical protein